MTAFTALTVLVGGGFVLCVAVCVQRVIDRHFNRKIDSHVTAALEPSNCRRIDTPTQRQESKR